MRQLISSGSPFEAAGGYSRGRRRSWSESASRGCNFRENRPERFLAEQAEQGQAHHHWLYFRREN